MKLWSWVRVLLIVGMLTGLAGSPVMGETADSQSAGAYWKGYFTDTGSILLSPFEWEREDWLKASLVAGTTLVLIHNDQGTQDYFQNHRTDSGDHLANFVENFGDPKAVIPALALFYGYGRMTQDLTAQEAALYSLESATIAIGGTYGLKLLTHRSRPKTGADPDTWDGISGSFSDNQLSFPSAHSAIAFSTATVFSIEYKDVVWVPYLSYTLATCVALSRINDNEHWGSDVFFGSVLGWYTAKSIMDKHGNGEKSDITVLPFGTKHGFGLSANYQF